MTWCHLTQSHQAMNLMVSPPRTCREIFHSLIILAKLHSPTQIVYLDHSPRLGMVMTTFWFIYTSRTSMDTTKYLVFRSLSWILSFPTTFLSPCSTSRPLILPDWFRSAPSTRTSDRWNPSVAWLSCGQNSVKALCKPNGVVYPSGGR